MQRRQVPPSLNDEPVWFTQQSHRLGDEVPSPTQFDCEKHWENPVELGRDDGKRESYNQTTAHE